MTTPTLITVLLAMVGFGVWTLACVVFGMTVQYRKQSGLAPPSLPTTHPFAGRTEDDPEESDTAPANPGVSFTL